MKLVILIAALFIILPLHLFAWGKKGHHIVAEIAYHFLDSATRSKVEHYLQGTSFEDAATWMDDMRSNVKYDYMKPWHYIDIEKDQKYVPSSSDRNIITILNTAIEELHHKDKLNDDQIKTDLFYIFHLVGDIHQPLHTGYPEDKGGNLIDVSYLYKSYHTNLHEVWDDEIIDSKKINVDSCLKQYKNYSPKVIKNIQEIHLTKWLNESRSFLPDVYNFKNDFINENYIERNYVVVENQLLKAGIRLAAILQALLK